MFRSTLSQLLLALLTIAVACTSDMPKDAPQSLKDVANVMDKLSDAEAKYGTMGISSPILATTSSTFEFNVSPTAEDFYNDAKTSRQGSASVLEQTLTSLAAGLSAKIAPPALGGIGAITTQPTTQPVSMQDLLNELKSFNPPATQPALGITDRTALLTAAGDNAVKAMCQLLGNPSLASQFKSKRVVFGVSTVSVNPGWQTTKHYAANVAMNSCYVYEQARRVLVDQYVHDASFPAIIRAHVAYDYGYTTDSLPSDLQSVKLDPVDQIALSDYFLDSNTPISAPSGGGPLVAAVAPFTDTQTLDLQSSYLDQQQLALNFMIQALVSGASVQANAALDYLHNLQQNFNTVDADTVTNAYSNGTIFGFQVGPSLKAIAKLGKGDASGPAEILGRTSFPALIIFGFDVADVMPKIKIDSQHGNRYVLYEPNLEVQGINQWVPIEGDGSSPVLRESDKLGLSYSINHDQDVADKDPNLKDFPTTRMMDARIVSLKTEVFGGGAELCLPIELMSGSITPAITSIKPAQVTQGVDTSISLAGSNLQNVLLDTSKIKVLTGKATVSTQPSDKPTLTSDGQITLKVNVTQDPVILQLQSIFNENLYTPSLTISSKPFGASLIFPSSVELDSSNGQVTPQTLTILITGDSLDQVDPSKITATQQGKQLPPLAATSALNGQAIQISNLTVSAPYPIVFELPNKNGSKDHIMLMVSAKSATTKPIF